MPIQTATNPTTGERIAFINGEWVPFTQSATNAAGQKAFMVGGQWMAEPEPTPEPQPEKGFFSGIGSLLKQSGEQALGAAKVAPSVISGNVSPELAGTITEQVSRKPTDQPKELTEVLGAFKDEAQQYEEAKGFGPTAKAVGNFALEFGKQAITNPKGVAYLTAQSAAQMAPSIAGMIAGGKIGGIAGAATPIPGGAAIGATIGAIGGGFSGQAPMEVGSEFIDRVGTELRDRNLEPTQENVEALLKDKAFVDRAISEARTKGVTTAAIDAAMTVGAGRYATGPRRAAIKAAQGELGAAAKAADVAKRAEEILKQGTTAQRAGRAVGRGAGAVGIDVVGGGLSEAGGQYAAYGKVNPEDVALEMLGELGGAGIEVPSAAYSAGKDYITQQAKKEAAQAAPVTPPAAKPAPTQQQPATEGELDIGELERRAGMQSQQEPAPQPTKVEEPATQPQAVVQPPAQPAVEQPAVEQPAVKPEPVAQETPKAPEVATLPPKTEASFNAPNYGAPEGTVRVFHSGELGDGSTARQANTNPAYISLSNPDMPMFYTDIPANDPRITNPENKSRSGNVSIELTPEESAGLSELSRDQFFGLEPEDQGRVLERAPEEEAQNLPPAAGEMAGQEAPIEEGTAAELADLTKEQQALIDERNKLQKRGQGTSLFQALRSSLNDGEMSELAGRGRQVGKNPFINLKAPKGRTGSSMEDMVTLGVLDDFLPYQMRTDYPTHDSGEAAEYIREKLRNGQYYTYETELEIGRLDLDIQTLEDRIKDLLSIEEMNLEIQRALQEQRELDQAAEEFKPQGKTGAAPERQGQEARPEAVTEPPVTEGEELKLESPSIKDVTDQEERKAKAEERDQQEQIRKESEAGAGQFELTQEEGRQDTTGDIFAEPPKQEEPKDVSISSEQERKEALDKFKAAISIPIKPFRAVQAHRAVILKPSPLTASQKNEIISLASDALDLGLPAAVLGNVTAGGSTRMESVAVMSSSGWLMLAKRWKEESRASKLQTLIHEFAHAVDTSAGMPSDSAKWNDAHTELENWFKNSQSKLTHPLAYPFAPQFKGRVRIKMESFAQAFGLYFTAPADLQTNAPEAYSQIQSIVERIQNESQAARAAGTTKTGTAGIKVQPARSGKNEEVQPSVGAERPGVGKVSGNENRATKGLITDEAERSSNLMRWFGDSKVADKDGKPIRLYTGTSKDVDFSKFKIPKNGAWFTTNPEEASMYAKENDSMDFVYEGGKFTPVNTASRVMPVYVRIENPATLSEADMEKMRYASNYKKVQGQIFDQLRAKGHDGVDLGGGIWVVLGNPNQIKSATGNRGTFGESQDINAMEATLDEQTRSANFKRWAKGLPVYESAKDAASDRGVFKVYHATPKSFSEFKPGGERVTDSGPAIWLATSPDSTAATFRVGSEKHGWKEGANIMPLYARIERPLVIDSKDMMSWARQVYGTSEFPQLISQKTVDDLIKDGYDSIIAKGGPLKWGENNDEFIVFNPNQLKSATGNIGTYSLESQDINESQRNVFGEEVTADWNTPTDSKLLGKFGKDDVIRTLQDKNIDVKRVIQAISSVSGQIADRWNTYLREELYHGRTAKRTEDFLNDDLKPLLKEMNDKGVTIGEFEKYLHNRHAEAYNEQVAKVNFDDEDMHDGGSGIKTQDARDYLASLPEDKRKVYESLAKRIDAITKGTRDLLVKSGLEKPKTIKAWEEAFPDYVPLQREDADFAYTSASTGTGRGFDQRGSFSRRAMGSKRNVVDILSNIAMQRERAIVKAEKNRVSQSVYGLAIQNPNPDFWLAINPLAEKFPKAAIEELMALGIDESDAQFFMQEPKQRAIDPKRGEVIRRVNTTLRNNPNVLATRVNGEDRYVFFNQNDERAKQTVTALKNLDADQLGQVMGILAKGTRYLASINTQYNPFFGAFNFLRDVQGAALQLSTTPIAGKQKQVIAGAFPALKAIYSDLRNNRKGVAKEMTEWKQLWDEFQEHGGQTGYRDVYSRSQDRSLALQRELKRLNQGNVMAATRAAFDWLSDYNDAMENAVRLSAYKAALESGLSKDRAASVAKNLTVNFNRKGTAALYMGALYAFFNAAVQGSTRLVQTLRGPAGKKIAAGGLLLGAAQSIALMLAGFDEDEPPEFVRERNLIIPIGGGNYAMVPMPLGYHVFPGTGRILTDGVLDFMGLIKSRKGVGARATDLMSMYMEAFNPIGNAGWSAQTIAPTLADPWVALGENKDWTGKRIAKEDFSNLDPTPGYTRAKDTATWWSTQLAEFLNYASGGTKYQPGKVSPTPDQIDYLIGQATGGVGREASKIASATRAFFAGEEEVPMYKVPVVGRFIGETRGAAVTANKFYDNLTHLNKLQNEIKGRIKDGGDVSEVFRDNPEAALYKTADKVYEQVKKLKDKRDKLKALNADSGVVKAINSAIEQQMKTLNDAVDRLEVD